MHPVGGQPACTGWVADKSVRSLSEHGQAGFCPRFFHVVHKPSFYPSSPWRGIAVILILEGGNRLVSSGVQTSSPQDSEVPVPSLGLRHPPPRGPIQRDILTPDPKSFQPHQLPLLQMQRAIFPLPCLTHMQPLRCSDSLSHWAHKTSSLIASPSWKNASQTC